MSMRDNDDPADRTPGDPDELKLWQVAAIPLIGAAMIAREAWTILRRRVRRDRPA
jgi:hypothetical protein